MKSFAKTGFLLATVFTLGASAAEAQEPAPAPAGGMSISTLSQLGGVEAALRGRGVEAGLDADAGWRGGYHAEATVLKSLGGFQAGGGLRLEGENGTAEKSLFAGLARSFSIGRLEASAGAFAQTGEKPYWLLVTAELPVTKKFTLAGRADSNGDYKAEAVYSLSRRLSAVGGWHARFGAGAGLRLNVF